MDTEPSSVPGGAGRRVRVVVIAGDSNGDALERVIGRLRPASGLAIVVASVGAQSEPTLRTTSLPSITAHDRTPLLPGRIHVIPHGHIATIVGDMLQLRPSLDDLGPVDRMLRSLANERGLEAITVVVAGAGDDGPLQTSPTTLPSADQALTRPSPERAEDARGLESAVRTSEARFRCAVGAAPLIVLHQGLDLRYTWGHLLGAPIDFIGHGNPEAFPGDSGAQLATIQHEVVTSGRGQRAEIELTLDGQPRVFDFRFEPIVEAGGTAGVVSVGFDITDSKLAVRRLIEADRRKDEFLATLSHELRNPLTPLRSALDLQKLAGDDPERVDRARAIMERQVDQLTQLVDDLLDLSRISQNKLKLARRPIALADVFEAAVEATHPLIERRRHQLTVELPDPGAVVDGDFTRLTQILVNLLNNAGKYTPPGGAITLSACLDLDRRTVAVNVRDTGVGITPDLMPHLFEIFVQRSDALGRSRDGLGIGLNLVRRLVELHGGTVRAESEGAGLGSLFVVEFPLAEGGS